MKQSGKYIAILAFGLMAWPATVAASGPRHGGLQKAGAVAFAHSAWSRIERPFNLPPETRTDPQVSPAYREAHAFFTKRDHAFSSAFERRDPFAAPASAGEQRPQDLSGPTVTADGHSNSAQTGTRRDLTTASDWTASGAPRPAVPADPQVTVDAISCPAVNGCFALGSYANAAGAFPGLLLRQTAGSWTATAPPLPSGAAANGFVNLYDIDCASSTQCVAVGNYSDTPGTEYDGQADTQALVETLQAGAWTPSKAPLPNNADFAPDASLFSVSCPTTSSCTAVGSYNVSGRPVPFISTDTNGGWISQAAPTPVYGGEGFGFFDAYPALIQIVCQNAGNCVSVGTFENNAGAGALFDREKNGAWTALKVPKGPQSFLDSVACTASSCLAVGGIDSNSLSFGRQSGYAVSEVNGKLTASQTPLPKGVSAKKVYEVDLYSAACSSSNCVAVGDWAAGTTSITDNSEETSIGPGIPLLLSLANGKWTAPDLSTDTFRETGELNKVSCPSAGTCVAGGSFLQPNGDTTLLFTGSGKNWLPQSIGGGPGFSHGELVAADCRNGCTLAGDYIDTAGNAQGLIVGGGPSWEGAQTALPLDAGAPQEIDLDFVSCAVAGSCVALGTNQDRSIVVETLSAGSWTVSQLPNPDDMAWGGEIDPYGLECTAEAQCVAIADYYDPRGFEEGEILVDSGGTWTELPAPYPQAAEEGELNDLSCPATGSCVVAGDYLKANGQVAGWIISGAGNTWGAYSAAAPAGQKIGKLTVLYAAGCVSPTSCVLVGLYGKYNKVLPLVVRGGGSSWKSATAPVPHKLGPASKFQAFLTGIACTTACVASGEAYNNASSPGIIESFSGTSAHAIVSPGPTGKSAQVSLSAPACSSTECVIAGQTEGFASESAYLLQGWGTSWKEVTPITGKPPQDSYLADIDCVAVGACESVGSIGSDDEGFEGDGTSQPLLASLAGKWSLALAPFPADAEVATGLEYAELESVSCPVATSCVSVGSYLDTNFVGQGLIEQQS